MVGWDGGETDQGGMYLKMNIRFWRRRDFLQTDPFVADGP